VSERGQVERKGTQLADASLDNQTQKVADEAHEYGWTYQADVIRAIEQ
jgi:hypothetical protein